MALSTFQMFVFFLIGVVPNDDLIVSVHSDQRLALFPLPSSITSKQSKKQNKTNKLANERRLIKKEFFNQSYLLKTRPDTRTKTVRRTLSILRPLPSSIRPIPSSLRPIPISIRPIPSSIRPITTPIRPIPSSIRPYHS